ncbi:hypothetical protein [Pseudomonas chlororaphis]|uniref:hypothetical protein n=1 Tax=Pseudomonas chlororaphis TaxID=587753 RepID=UPI000470F808|nr:hypothetical protein [Pseudomonas chlororaphis]
MEKRRLNGTRRPLLFSIGALILSPGIDRCMREGRLDPMSFLRRHARGDWGDVTDERWQDNDAGLQSGRSLESIYAVHRALSISIVTHADRSETRIALLSEI